MTLKTNKNIKKYIPKIIYAIIIIFLGFFFVKTALWENEYISAKVGSERDIKQPVTEQEVDETEITPEQVAEHIVPALHPRYLSIPTLNISNAIVIPLGVKATGELDTPYNIFQAGWYNASGTPGSGRPIILDGHNGGPNVVGIFKYLPNMKAGDKITIERGDGTLLTYTVRENNIVPLSESNDYMKKIFKNIDGKETLTIITCTGEWSQAQYTYLSRQFLRATLDQ